MLFGIKLQNTVPLRYEKKSKPFIHKIDLKLIDCVSMSSS